MQRPEPPLPAAVLFEPRCCERGYLWPHPPDPRIPEPLDPARLRLSGQLVDRIEEWYDSAPLTGLPADLDRGVELAYEVQRELVATGLDVEVIWGLDEHPVPVWERRGR